MRFLIVGAGAIGGYFGGRLAQKGEDVTFLVRSQKRKQLEETGLHVKSIHGNFHTPIRMLTSGEPADPFDCIILSVKAYHLQQVQQDIAPYIGENTLLLPLLNGYDHFASLKKAFGERNVLGGLCFIETTLDQEGTIIQTSTRHDIVFGEWEGGISDRTDVLLHHLDKAGFTATLSENIQRDIWQKYIFISSMSGITTLMGTPVGPILATPQARTVYERLVHEIVAIARNYGAPVDEGTEARTLKTMESLHPEMKSSMQRDMEKRLPVETDHLHGALLTLVSPEQGFYPVLEAVYGRLKVYEAMLGS
ncbi:2-dehydropantoate 2-reductase [compost metagenome]